MSMKMKVDLNSLASSSIKQGQFVPQADFKESNYS